MSYDRERQPCLAGYQTIPSIFSGMRFELRHLPRVTSRVVQVGEIFYELWSPNSGQVPFLPGYARDDAVPPPTNPSGWHWPFMRRTSQVSSIDFASPAFEPLPQHWIGNTTNPINGYFSRAYLDRLEILVLDLDRRIRELRDFLGPESSDWMSRPAFASLTIVSRLRLTKRWLEAVDLGVALQRGLREQDGWLSFILERRRQAPITLHNLRRMEMPLADDRHMGGWVNGSSEELVLRLMAARIPCFIVHEYQPGALTRSAGSSAPICTSFLQGTEVKQSLSDANPYQRIARNQGRLDSMTRGDEGRGTAPFATTEDERRSSSLYLERRLARPPVVATIPRHSRTHSPDVPADTMRVSTNILLTAPLDASPTRPSLPSSASPAVPSSVTPSSASAIPLAPSATRNRYAAPEPERCTIAADRVDWVVPPPIAPARNDKGKWERWLLEDYNEQRKRELYFGRFDIPPGVLDYQRFGAPVPPFPFIYPSGEVGIPHASSSWMYLSRAPASSDAGREMAHPIVTDLPPRLETGPTHSSHSSVAPTGSTTTEPPPSLPSPMPAPLDAPHEASTRRADDKGKGRDQRPDKKGKGKGRAETPAPEDSAAVPVLDMDVDYDDEGGGLTLETPGPREVASNALVVDGVAREVTAVLFRELAHEALWHARANPVAIVNGQGRMWIRFANASDGQRAFRTLNLIGHEIRVSFALDSDIHEASQYSRDIWTPESTEEMEISFPEAETASTTWLAMEHPRDNTPAPAPVTAAGSMANTEAAPRVLSMEQAASATNYVRRSQLPSAPRSMRGNAPLGGAPSATPRVPFSAGPVFTGARPVPAPGAGTGLPIPSGWPVPASIPGRHESVALPREDLPPLPVRTPAPVALLPESRAAPFPPRTTPRETPPGTPSRPSSTRLAPAGSNFPAMETPPRLPLAARLTSPVPSPVGVPSRQSLLQRLRSPVVDSPVAGPSRLPVMERFPQHPAQGMIPFPLRLHPSPFEDEAESSSPKRSHLDLEPGDEEGEAMPRKKKVRRGTRAGWIAKENQRIKDERARQAEDLLEEAEENADPSLTEWVATLDAVAEAEVAESLEAEFAFDEVCGEELTHEEVIAQAWEPMLGDDPPIAQGPY
ncbi:hypothetical protein C8R44DRAFT_880546 [Mycena epipterygia]|nr:hypothetical protein C8R44DRAFT_880546 [Mycena epipterygia]